MRPAKVYFFGLLPRAQMIDWDRSPTVQRIVRAPRKSGRTFDSPVKFRALTSETPPIRRETDVDRPSFFPNRQDIFCGMKFGRRSTGGFRNNR
jgi:hypothetical protein